MSWLDCRIYSNIILFLILLLWAKLVSITGTKIASLLPLFLFPQILLSRYDRPRKITEPPATAKETLNIADRLKWQQMLKMNEQEKNTARSIFLPKSDDINVTSLTSEQSQWGPSSSFHSHVQTGSGRPLRRRPAAATVQLARTGSPGASLPVTRAGPPPGGPVPAFNS